MSKPSILQVGQFPPALQAIIDNEFVSHPEQDLIDKPGLAHEVRAILTRSNYAIPVALLDRLPRLQVIATSGVGYDGIPVAAAQARAVVVTNTPGVLDSAVGELGVGVLLSLLRQIPQADRFVRSGQWETGLFPLATGLAGKFVGIVGLGRIGHSVARRLQGFEAAIGYHGSRPQAVAYEYFADLAALAERADVLIVCCPGGAATRHLVNADILRRLGPAGFLVNIARGTVVDESALVAALAQGGIAGAALDVFEQEPYGAGGLSQLPNTVLTPHIGSATVQTRERMLRLALDNIHRVLGGKPALTPVSPISIPAPGGALSKGIS